MPNALAKQPDLSGDTMLSVVAGGDCSKLTPDQKLAYYNARCEAAGLDPRAQPFAFVRLNGKEVLYALKAASDQLSAKHGVKLTISDQRTEEGIRIVTVRAEAKDGRVTEEIGALPIKGVQGEALANALMKCVTKAKRRAVLSLCGLGMLDETEIESVGAVATPPQVQAAAKVLEAPVVTHDLREPDQTRRAAEALVAAAEAAQTTSAVLDLMQRGKLVWKRATDKHGHNMTAATFRSWVGQILGAEKPSKDWTEQDVAALEEALDAQEQVP